MTESRVTIRRLCVFHDQTKWFNKLLSIARQPPPVFPLTTSLEFIFRRKNGSRRLKSYIWKIPRDPILARNHCTKKRVCSRKLKFSLSLVLVRFLPLGASVQRNAQEALKSLTNWLEILINSNLELLTKRRRKKFDSHFEIE